MGGAAVYCRNRRCIWSEAWCQIAHQNISITVSILLPRSWILGVCGTWKINGRLGWSILTGLIWGRKIVVSRPIGGLDLLSGMILVVLSWRQKCCTCNNSWILMQACLVQLVRAWWWSVAWISWVVRSRWLGREKSWVRMVKHRGRRRTGLRCWKMIGSISHSCCCTHLRRMVKCC